jgi:hypothetical protein
MDKRELR